MPRGRLTYQYNIAKRYSSFSPCRERRRDGGLNLPQATSWQDWIRKALNAFTAVLQFDNIMGVSGQARLGPARVGLV